MVKASLSMAMVLAATAAAALVWVLLRPEAASADNDGPVDIQVWNLLTEGDVLYMKYGDKHTTIESPVVPSGPEPASWSLGFSTDEAWNRQWWWTGRLSVNGNLPFKVAALDGNYPKTEDGVTYAYLYRWFVACNGVFLRRFLRNGTMLTAYRRIRFEPPIC